MPNDISRRRYNQILVFQCSFRDRPGLAQSPKRAKVHEMPDSRSELACQVWPLLIQGRQLDVEILWGKYDAGKKDRNCIVPLERDNAKCQVGGAFWSDSWQSIHGNGLRCHTRQDLELSIQSQPRWSWNISRKGIRHSSFKVAEKNRRTHLAMISCTVLWAFQLQ